MPRGFLIFAKLGGCVCVCVTLIFPQSSDVCQCFCRGSGNEKHLPGQSDFQVKLSPGKPAFW